VVHAVVDGRAAQEDVHELITPAAHHMRPEDDLGAVEREAAREENPPGPKKILLMESGRKSSG
jgi:hypothetical protein